MKASSVSKTLIDIYWLPRLFDTLCAPDAPAAQVRPAGLRAAVEVCAVGQVQHGPDLNFSLEREALFVIEQGRGRCGESTWLHPSRCVWVLHRNR